MNDITAILERIRQGMATAEDADILEAAFATLEQQRRDLEADNRCYAERYGPLRPRGEG